MAFLVTGVAGTSMKVCPVFPHQSNASFYCRKCRKNLANWMSNITQIAAKIVLKQSTGIKRKNHFCFWKNNEIKTNSYLPKNLLQQAQGDIRIFDGNHSSKCSFLRIIQFQIINTKLFSGSKIVDPS